MGVDPDKILNELEQRIMIVEDSPTVRFEVRLLLKQIGIVPIEVGGELGCFMKIEQYGRPVDLILMDLTLKNENGFELIEKIRLNEKYKNIKIIVLTEHADAQNVLKAREIGVDGYIRKPIDRESFLAKISETLDSEF